MADAVQYLMEKMVPELEDLQQLEIFDKEEIRQIVQKRRDFEYAMKRTPLRKVDCLRYIEYEINLEALRRQRKKRLGLKKHTLSDNTGFSRVNKIFERALMKHRGDIDLWLQHIAFCKNNGSNKLLSNLFTSALQVHPRNEAIWIEAASWEFSSNLNVDTARVLMQRSIRVNPQSKKLWLEYFRLEFLYVQKLRTRREVLGLDENSSKPVKELSLDIAPVEGEEGYDTQATKVVAEETSAVEQSRKAILSGAIPKIVYRNAIEAIPNDSAFRLDFLAIANLFPATYSKSVADVILETSTNDFAQDASVWSAYCQQPMHESDRELDDRRKAAIDRYEQAVSKLSTDAMREAYMHWCISELARTQSSAWFAQEMESTVNKLGPLSAKLYAAWVDYTTRVHGLNAAVTTASKATTAFPAEASLWLLQAQLVMRQASIQALETKPAGKRTKKQTETATSVYSAAIAVIERGLKHAADTSLLWLRYIQLLMSKPASGTVIRDAFKNALKAATPWSSHWAALRLQFLNWTHQTQGLEASRTLYKTFLSGQMLPNEDTRALLQWCVEAEAAEESSTAQNHIVKGLFEKLVDLYGKEGEDVWVDYVQYYRERNLHKEANEVYWRASRLFPASATLASLEGLN